MRTRKIDVSTERFSNFAAAALNPTCHRWAATAEMVLPHVARSQRASCCTCTHAMLAKPRFCRCRHVTCWSKIEVPLEFQGLGPLGAASWRRLSLCEFDSLKERACGS